MNMREAERSNRLRAALLRGLPAAFLPSVAFALTVALLLTATSASAQTTTPPDPGERQHESSLWVGLMTDWQLKGPWSLWLDTHYNTNAFFVLRPGITYKFDSGFSATAGYAYVLTDPGTGALERQEHRPWGQFVFPAKFGPDWALAERIRGELRIREKTANGEVTDGWIVVPRLRAQTTLSYFFARPSYGDWFLQPGIELLVQGGSNVGTNFLDSVRSSMLVGLKVNPFTFRAGYMARFIPSTSPPTYEHDAILWVNYSFERKEKKPEALPLPEAQNP